MFYSRYHWISKFGGNVLVYECDFNQCFGSSSCGWSHEIRNQMWLLGLLFRLIKMTTERLFRILNALSKVRIFCTLFAFLFSGENGSTVVQ